MYLRLFAMNFFFEQAPIPASMFKNDCPMIACTFFDYMHKLESKQENKINSVQSGSFFAQI